MIEGESVSVITGTLFHLINKIMKRCKQYKQHPYITTCDSCNGCEDNNTRRVDFKLLLKSLLYFLKGVTLKLLINLLVVVGLVLLTIIILSVCK
jgi:hypothetical protein